MKRNIADVVIMNLRKMINYRVICVAVNVASLIAAGTVLVVMSGTQVDKGAGHPSAATPPAVSPAANDVISGTVTDNASPADPLEKVSVEVRSVNDSNIRFYGTTEADGSYKVLGLPSGSYTVCFAGATGSAAGATLAQCSNDKPNDGSAEPDPVTVSEGKNVVINAALAIGGIISGTVTDNASLSRGLGAVGVVVTPSGSNNPIAFATTKSDGSYTVLGLPAGKYAVCFHPVDTTLARCSNNKPIDGSAEPDPVTVTLHAETRVDAALNH